MESTGRQRVLTGVLIGVVALVVCAISAVAAVYVYTQLSNRQAAAASTPAAQVDAPRLSKEGLLVSAVYLNSAADVAGLLRGDILLQADEQPLATGKDLQQIVWAKDAGDALSLLVLRGEQTAVFTLILADNLPRLGIELLEAGSSAPQAIEQLPVSGPPVISVVVPGSPAAAAGLAVGDVIVAIGETAVTPQALLTRDELFAAMQDKQPGDALTVMLRRGPDTLLRELTLAQHPDDANRGYLGIELEN